MEGSSSVSFSVSGITSRTVSATSRAASTSFFRDSLITAMSCFISHQQLTAHAAVAVARGPTTHMKSERGMYSTLPLTCSADRAMPENISAPAAAVVAMTAAYNPLVCIFIRTVVLFMVSQSVSGSLSVSVSGEACISACSSGRLSVSVSAAASASVVA